MASSLFLGLDGEPLHENQVLGYGGTGVVIRRGQLAVKIPLRHPWSSEADVQSNMEVIMHEQSIFERFKSFPDHQIDGIVPCIGLQVNATQLALVGNGDLRAYLDKHRPTPSIQIAWFRQMARAIGQVHDKRVIIADIATRNFLLDSDLSIKICDFSEASILPMRTVMETADDDGFSIQTDIGQLGAVIYEVSTGQECDFDLFKDGIPEDGRAIWPPRTSLPSTEGLWLGSIIEKCWLQGGFQNAHDLLRVLNSATIEGSETSGVQPHVLPLCLGQRVKKPIMFCLIFGVIMVAGVWAQRQRR